MLRADRAPHGASEVTSIVIHIDAEPVLAILGDDGRNWSKRAWSIGRSMGLHEAIRRCSPQPGDAYLIEQVASIQGWGPIWNDARNTSWADIRARINGGINITDDNLAETFGSSWRAVVHVVRTVAATTPEHFTRMNETERTATWSEAWQAALDAGFVHATAAWNAALAAAGDAARGVGGGLVWADATWAGFAWIGAAWTSVARVAWDAAGAVVVGDLVGQHGLTQAHVDTLLVPFVTVFGPIPGDAVQ